MLDRGRILIFVMAIFVNERHTSIVRGCNAFQRNFTSQGSFDVEFVAGFIFCSKILVKYPIFDIIFSSFRNLFHQIFHYTRCNTPKRVTSLRGPYPHHCARTIQVLLEEMSQQWRVVGNTVSDLTGPRFKLQSFHSDTNELPLDLNLFWSFSKFGLSLKI